MLFKGKCYEELIKRRLMIEQYKILSFALVLKASDFRTVSDFRIRTEENAETMSNNKMALFYPFFLLIFL